MLTFDSEELDFSRHKHTAIKIVPNKQGKIFLGKVCQRHKKAKKHLSLLDGIGQCVGKTWHIALVIVGTNKVGWF
jgi:hypothetical protein